MKGMQITRNPLNFNKHQFLNRETQFETGYIDLQNRQYDPHRGQFTSIDALAELNRRFSPFVYGNNNGLRFIDPDGMMAQRVKGSDGNWHDVSEDDGVDVYNAPAEDDKDKGKKVSTGRGGGDNGTPFSPPEHLQASSLQNASISQGRMDNFSREDKAAQLGVNIAGVVESGVSIFTKGLNFLKNLGAIDDVIQEQKILYHYTNEIGMNAIVESKALNPSLKAINPKDVRYGEGQYLSDILPGTKTARQLSKTFINTPNQYKYTHYVEINVTGLSVQMGRDAIYVIPNTKALNISKRIISYGKN